MMNRRLLYMILMMVIIVPIGGYAHSCAHPPGDAPMDYREAMRDFVIGISTYAKAIDQSFLIIPQNGHELLTQDGTAAGRPATEYIAAIDGIGREDLFYGYDDDDVRTPPDITAQWLPFMGLAKTGGLAVLVTDYCSTREHVDDSYARNTGYIPFAADSRDLDDIPAYPEEPIDVNEDDISSLSDARNFLYLIDPGGFSDRAAFLNAVRDTDYDIVLIDLFDDDGEPLSRGDIGSLKVKRNGGKRLVIAYLSIGEAEDYRYYWDPLWSEDPPAWLGAENENWAGNYSVHYWEPEWQRIIYGGGDSYLKMIIDAGFDGAYLDIIDAFERFESEE
jgi:cysteinyl-tRNA synthetase